MGSNPSPSSLIIGTEAVPAEGIIRVTALMIPPAPTHINAGQEPNI